MYGGGGGTGYFSEGGVFSGGVLVRKARGCDAVARFHEHGRTPLSHARDGDACVSQT